MSTDEQLFSRFGKEFAPGTVLCEDGDNGKEMYIIQGGAVKITKRIGEVEKTLAVLKAGEFFGEMAILNNKPRSANAIVTEPAKILVIDPQTFEAMIKGNSEIALRIIKKLAARLQEADNQIESLLIKDSNMKVVHGLMRAAREVSGGADGPVNLNQTVRDIAGLVGLSPTKVEEVIGKIQRASLVELAGDKVVVKSIDKMEKFIEFLAMKEQFGEIS